MKLVSKYNIPHVLSQISYQSSSIEYFMSLESSRTESTDISQNITQNFCLLTNLQRQNKKLLNELKYSQKLLEQMNIIESNINAMIRNTVAFKKLMQRSDEL
ncbi:Hypothetical_protein [Hexamita inflata]|uniref:Hypothetical_protein n=1 Tax=Hexamita inflata TaxID=28002 RepID=A0AA86RJ23_9EUKA|nr:Hypothetical protein HINF_LOCUS60847 [Hexamita inflata]